MDDYRLHNGKPGQYHYVSTFGSAFVIPKKNDNTFVLIRQYRYLNKKNSIEFPGGGVKEGVEPVEQAKRELLEEAGVVAGKLTPLGEFNPYNGVTDEICFVFLAEELEFKTPEPEETEEIEIIELSEENIINKIKKGEIWDGMSLAAWALYLYR